jgi:hypothetical protein
MDLNSVTNELLLKYDNNFNELYNKIVKLNNSIKNKEEIINKMDDNIFEQDKIILILKYIICALIIISLLFIAYSIRKLSFRNLLIASVIIIIYFLILIYYEAYRKFTLTEIKKEMDKIGINMQDYTRSLLSESIAPYSCPMKCNKKYIEIDQSKIKKINFSENTPILNIDPQTNVWKYGDIPDDLYTSYKLPPSAFFKSPNNIPLYNVTPEEEQENSPKSKFSTTYPMSTYYKCKWNGDINNTGGLSSEDGKYSSIPCSYKSNYSEEGKYICMDNPNKVGLENAKCDEI